MVGDARRDHRAIGEESDEEALLLGQGINVEKILAGKNFAASEEDPQAAGFDQFIKEAVVFFEAEFAFPRLGIAHGKIVVTVPAFERATVRNFDGNFDGHTAALVARVDLRGKITVGFGLYQTILSANSS